MTARDSGESIPATRSALHDGLLVMQGQAPYEIQVHWVYGAPLRLGLAPEARQALLQERIVKILAQMSSNTDSLLEAREVTRPTRDSGTAADSGESIPATRSALHDGLLVMQGQVPYEIQVHWVYGAPLRLGLAPEARQALLQERIVKILAQMSSNTDSLLEAREVTRPTRDSGSAADSGESIPATRSELHDGLLVMQGQVPYEIQVPWVYGAPLRLGLAPEARQALLQERIAKILAQMSSNTDSLLEAREVTRPTRDSGPAAVT